MGVKRLVLLLVLLFVSVGLLLGGSAGTLAYNGFNGYEDVASNYSFLSVSNVLGSEAEDAFKEKGEVLGAELYIFRLNYGIADKKEKGQIEIREVFFQLPLISGLEEDEIINLELVIDENGNGKADPDELTVGGQGKINWESKIIKFTGPFEHQGDTTYILRADFPHLEDGDFLVVKMKGSLIVIGHDVEIDQRKVAGNGYMASSYHIEGDPAPILSWKVQWNDGVSSDKGRSADVFEFSVIYLDINNDPPKTRQVWVDLNKDGQYQEEEKFEMEQLHSNSNYQTGKEFTADLIIIPADKEGPVSYQFYFTNTNGKVANGQGTQQREIFVAPLVEAYVWVDESERKFVGQKEILLNLGFVHYIGVELKEEDFEKIDFSPFKVEKIVFTPRQPVADNPNEDYQIIHFLLTLSKVAEPGVYEIPPVLVHYTASCLGTTIEGEVLTKPLEEEKLEVEKLPLAFKINYPKEVINLGDKILVIVDIYYEPTREIFAGELKEADLRINLAPFEILSLSTEEKDVCGVKLTRISLLLSLYWVPQQKEESFLLKLPLSQVKVPYQILNAEEGEIKEKQFLILPDLPVRLNTLVKSDKASPKWLLEIVEIEKLEFVWFFFWTGVGLVILFVLILTVILIKKIKEKRKLLSSNQLIMEAEKRVGERLATIRDLVKAGKKVAQAEFVDLFVRFKVYLGLQEGIGISQEEAWAKTSQELLELLEKAGYEKKVTEAVKGILEILNKVYKQKMKQEEIESLLKRLGDFFLFGIKKK